MSFQHNFVVKVTVCPAVVSTLSQIARLYVMKHRLFHIDRNAQTHYCIKYAIMQVQHNSCNQLWTYSPPPPTFICTHTHTFSKLSIKPFGEGFERINLVLGWDVIQGQRSTFHGIGFNDIVSATCTCIELCFSKYYRVDNQWCQSVLLG